MDATATLVLDATDPLVVLIAWTVTWATLKWAPSAWKDKLRRAAPALAMLVALFARAAWDSGMGEGASWDTVWHALVAGATTVAAHSQIREVFKAMDGDAGGEEAPKLEVAPEGPAE